LTAPNIEAKIPVRGIAKNTLGKRPFLSPLLILGEGEGEVTRIACQYALTSKRTKVLAGLVTIVLEAIGTTSPQPSPKIRRGDQKYVGAM
jgi:hypothetical protein